VIEDLDTSGTIEQNSINPSNDKDYSPFEADADKADLSHLSQQCPTIFPTTGTASNPVIPMDTADCPTCPTKKTQIQGRKEDTECYLIEEKCNLNSEKAADVDGVPQDICAAKSEGQNVSYQIHPSAVLLVMAWTRHKQIPRMNGQNSCSIWRVWNRPNRLESGIGLA
jgi:hypothetical protein